MHQFDTIHEIRDPAGPTEEYAPSPELLLAVQELFSINERFNPPLIGLDWCHSDVKRFLERTLCTVTAPGHMALSGLISWLIWKEPLVAFERYHPDPATVCMMTKLRSMIPKAEALEHIFVGEGTLQQLKQSGNDPRITPLGRILRALSVDELPQLMDVMMGYLALIGPRAFTDTEWDTQIFPNSDNPIVGRFIDYLGTGIRYGVFGMYGIFGRSELSVMDRIWLGVMWMENTSILVDMKILERTVPALVLRRGAY